MNTVARIQNYRRQNNGRDLTPAQRRRMIKNAAAEKGSLVIREDGMGFSRGHQGEKILIGFEDNRPVSGAPVTEADLDAAFGRDED